ncbi:hypothetical protein CL619_02025, partial [archaeon]|nr:hypothetical protein [archaeon]
MEEFIIICGPGRSGTSLTANVISELGFNFGDLKIRKKDHNKDQTYPGSYEDMSLGRAIQLWGYALYPKDNWNNPYLIPKENKKRGPWYFHPIRTLIMSLGDSILNRALKKNKDKKTLVMKRPSAIWWIWRISKLSSKHNYPKPKLIFCRREEFNAIDGIFGTQGANPLFGERYLKLINKMIEFYKMSKRG